MTAMAALSRRLCRSLLSNSKASLHHDILPVTYCTNNLFFRSVSDITDSDMDLDSHSLTNRPSVSPSSSQSSTQTRTIYNRPLENGLDAGIYKVHWCTSVYGILFSMFDCLHFCFDNCSCLREGYIGRSGGAKSIAEAAEEWENSDAVISWDGWYS